MLRKVFREQAIEAQQQLDDLPQAMTVIGSWVRPTLFLLFIALCAATIWSAFIQVPVKVRGHGVLVDRSGELLQPLRARSEGVLSTLQVAIGDRVSKDQPIGRMKLYEREATLEKSKKSFRLLEKKIELNKKLEKLEVSSANDIYNERQSSLNKNIDDLRKRIDWLEKRQHDAEKLLRDGVVTRNRVHGEQFELVGAREKLAGLEIEFSGIMANKKRLSDGHRRKRLQMQSELAQAREDIASQEQLIKDLTTIVSPIEGTVTEVIRDRGDYVKAGQPIIRILHSDGKIAKNLEALVFVPMGSGKRVMPSDSVFIKPGSLPTGTHDMLRAKVISISEAPVTADALKHALGNEGLAHVTAGTGAPFAVRVRLDVDEKTKSGFAWTSGNGPALMLTPGTPLSAHVVIEHRPLLVLALPALKRLLGEKTSIWTADPA